MASVLAALVGFVWIWALGVPDFPMDDAYIVQHVVDGVGGGVDVRFGGSPMNGATSPAHVLLVWSLSRFIPVGWAQLLLALASYVAWVAAVSIAARREGLSALWRNCLGVIAATAGLVLYQFFNGLETGLAIAVVAWSLVLFSNKGRVRPIFFLLLGVAPLVRPELILISGLLAIWYWMPLLTSGEGAASRLHGIVVSMMWGLLAFSAVLVFSLYAGAGVLSNTVSAKTYFFAEGCWSGWHKLEIVFLAVARFLGVLGMGWVAVGLLGVFVSRLRWVLLCYVLAFIFAYWLRLPGALSHNWDRYQYVLLPVIMMGWVSLLAYDRVWVARVSKVVVSFALCICVLQFERGWVVLRDAVYFTRVELSGVANWVDQNVPRSAVVLVHDAGYISRIGGQHLVDVVGLKSPSSVVQHHQLTWARCSRDPKAIANIAASSGAEYFVVLGGWDGNFLLTESLRRSGWGVVRADASRGATAYRVYRLQRPDF